MTREELKKHCKKQIEMCETWAKAKGENPCGKVYEEHKMILELLEQQPCEDAISRQAVLDAIMANCIWENEYNLTSSRIKKTVESLPSVTPKQKTGRWIEHFDESGKWYECDQCHTDWEGSVNYCPNCGARMGDEREENERFI